MMERSLQGQYGGFLSRLVAFILDVVIIGLVDFFLYWLVSNLVKQFTGFSMYACPPVQWFHLKALTCSLTSWGFSIYLAVFPLIYFLFFWILAGQTLGDYAMGVRVVRLNGRRMNLISGIIRFFSYFLCFLSLGLGFLWILVDDRRQGWHDKLARTCVIYSWEARQDVTFIQKLNQRLLGKGQQT